MSADNTKDLPAASQKQSNTLLRFNRWTKPVWVRTMGLVIYYLAIILGLIVIYGRGNFSTPKFLYQGF